MTQIMPVCSDWLFVACQVSGCVENAASEGNSPSSQRGFSAKGETDGNGGLLHSSPFWCLYGRRSQELHCYKYLLAVIRSRETSRCNYWAIEASSPYWPYCLKGLQSKCPDIQCRKFHWTNQRWVCSLGQPASSLVEGATSSAFWLWLGWQYSS